MNRTHALELAKTCSFPHRRISVRIYVGWDALQWATSLLALAALGLRLHVI